MNPKRTLFTILGILALALFGSAGGVSIAEHHDPFCGSCHTIPETTYLSRRTATLEGGIPPDLASAHFTASQAQFDCIDCHNGTARPIHQVETLTLGFEDLLVYLNGDVDATVEKGDVSAPHLITESCTACHLAEILEPGFDNHIHTMLEVTRDVWLYPGTQRTIQAEDPELYFILTNDGLNTIETEETIECMDCHQGHVSAPAATNFLDLAEIQDTTCNACHMRLSPRNDLDVIDG